MATHLPEEFASMENKELRDWVAKESTKRSEPSARAKDSLPEFMPGSHGNIAQGLQELMEQHKGDPVYEQISELIGEQPEQTHQRRKRDIEELSKEPLPLRSLPISRLISTGEDFREPSPGVEAKLRNFVPSNNPKYKSIELATQGLKDRQMLVKRHSYESDEEALPVIPRQVAEGQKYW